jgi:hypothetical protein
MSFLWINLCTYYIVSTKTRLGHILGDFFSQAHLVALLECVLDIEMTFPPKYFPNERKWVMCIFKETKASPPDLSIVEPNKCFFLFGKKIKKMSLKIVLQLNACLRVQWFKGNILDLHVRAARFFLTQYVYKKGGKCIPDYTRFPNGHKIYPHFPL